jgi:signal transduction histidine kinase/ligand-binding sensor domain-containing protein/CheY-like chemotaxis protein
MRHNITSSPSKLSGEVRHSMACHRSANTESLRRIFLAAAGALMLCSSAYAGAERIIAIESPPDGDVVKLPVLDKQDIRFRRLSADGEAFQNHIGTIAQDNNGFLWLGGHGLYRYDGYSLKSYLHAPEDSNSMSDDSISAIFKDRDGILWVGTYFAGLNRLDPARGTLTHYRHESGNARSLGDDRVMCVYQDRSGVLWVGTERGLDRLDPATNAFVHYRSNSQDAGGNAVNTIYEDRAGKLWAGTESGLVNLDRVTGRFSRFLTDLADPHSVGHNHASRILEDRSGVLWVAIGSWLSSFDRATGKFTRYSFHSEEPGAQSVAGVTSVYEDRDGVLWLGTVDSGLLKLDRERKTFSRYTKEPGDPNSLPDNQVSALFEDAEGVLWAGTSSGMCSFLRKPLQSINYQHEGGRSPRVGSTFVWSVLEDSKGLFWIGASGLTRLDRKTGQSILFEHDSKDRYSLSTGPISALLEDRAGTLWAGSYGGGLNRFDRNTGRFFAYRHQPKRSDSLSSDLVLSLFEDRQGALWVGTQAGGLNRFDSDTGRFTSWRHDPEDPHSLSHNNVITIFQDRAGFLWLGTLDGLNRFDPQTGQFLVYRHNPHDPRSLSQSNVNAIWEDRRGSLWIATGGGVNQLDRAQGTFTSFTKRDGLPGNFIQTILEDGQGYLWLATDNGLSRFQPQTRIFRNYSVLDGLPGGIFATSRNGEIILGSTNAVTTFYPSQLSDNPYAPPVVLTDLLLFNTPVRQGAKSPLRQPIWATDSLTLTHKQSIFTLEFSALSFAAPEKNRYRYRLLGLEKDWNEVDSRQRLATYTSLPAAKYVFQLQGSNNDGIWNPKITTLAIAVLPPWWATWWFQCLAGLTLAALIFTAYRYRIRGLQLAGIRLEAQVAERTRELEGVKDAAERANQAKSIFLANMSHELRTPLNSILGFSALVRDAPDLAEEHRKDLEIVSRGGEHLLGLIDDVLDMAKIEAGRITLDHAAFNLSDLVQDNVDMLRARARDKGLELFLQTSPLVPRVVRSDAGKLRQVLVNLIGNALKYTERGSVTVRLDAKPINDRILLILEVEDTGIGIAPQDQARIFAPFVQIGKSDTQNGTGLGLSITRQFVQLMDGTISIQSTPGEGSLFRVELPVEPADESELAETHHDNGHVAGLAPGQPEYRILIVEDKKANWLLLQRLLVDAGFQVRVAEDGAQGVEMFRSWQPQLIWMDLRLPVLGGLEAAREIRALEGGRQVKIVALTASAFARQREEVLAAGLDDFVRKPYRREEIFECMARHLGVRYLYRETVRTSPADPAVALEPEALATLPKHLREELADALVRLDAGPISEVIGRVSEQDAQLGGVLASCAKRFAYTRILNALENGNGRLREEAHDS